MPKSLIAPPRWLNTFNSSIDINSPQYHYLSTTRDGYQSVTVTQNGREILMYWTKRDNNTSKGIQNSQKRVIDSMPNGTNHNSHTDTPNSPNTGNMETIIEEQSAQLHSYPPINDISNNTLSNTTTDQNNITPQNQPPSIPITENLFTTPWIKKYEPNKFAQLLSDSQTNRQLLTWLKGWDYIVFGIQVKGKGQRDNSIIKASISNNNHNTTNNHNTFTTFKTQSSNPKSQQKQPYKANSWQNNQNKFDKSKNNYHKTYNPNDYNKYDRKSKDSKSPYTNNNSSHNNSSHNNNSHNNNTYNNNNNNITIIPTPPTTQYIHPADNLHQSRLILLSGPPGCGKSTLARVIAHHCGYVVEEVNASDERTGDTIVNKLISVGTNQTVRPDGKPTLLVIDEVDGVADGQHKINDILKVIFGNAKTNNKKNHTNSHKSHQNNSNITANNPTQSTETAQSNGNAYQNTPSNNSSESILRRPIIFICNDPFARCLRQLRRHSHTFYMTPPDPKRIFSRLRDILEMEGAYIEHDMVRKVADMSAGDVRQSVGILEMVWRRKCGGSSTTGSNSNLSNHSSSEQFVSNKQANQSTLQSIRSSLLGDFRCSPQTYLRQVIFGSQSRSLSCFSQQTNSVFSHKTPINASTSYNTSSSIASFSLNLSRIESMSLLDEMFFHNLLVSNHAVSRDRATAEVYWQWCQADWERETGTAKLITFLLYNLKLRSREIQKVQFPSIAFEKQRNKRTNMEVINRFLTSLPTHLSFNMRTPTLFVHEVAYALCSCILGAGNKQEGLWKAIEIMAMYGLKLADRSSQYVLEPGIDGIVIGLNRDKAYSSNLKSPLFSPALTPASFSFIRQNFEYALMKSAIIKDLALTKLDSDQNRSDPARTMFDASKMSPSKQYRLLDSQHLKRKHLVLGSNSVKYRFTQGSGTQVKSELKFGDLLSRWQMQSSA